MIEVNITCPKCGVLFTEYGAFYDHYMGEPTPLEKQHDVAVFENSWRQVGNILQSVLHGLNNIEAQP